MDLPPLIHSLLIELENALGDDKPSDTLKDSVKSLCRDLRMALIYQDVQGDAWESALIPFPWAQFDFIRLILSLSANLTEQFGIFVVEAWSILTDDRVLESELFESQQARYRSRAIIDEAAELLNTCVWKRLRKDGPEPLSKIATNAPEGVGSSRGIMPIHWKSLKMASDDHVNEL